MSKFLFVADGSGVRCITAAFPWPFVFSLAPDGNRVIWFDDLSRERYDTVPTPADSCLRKMVVYSLDAGRSQKVAIPDDFHAAYNEYFVSFAPGGRIVIRGTSHGRGRCLCWSEKDGWRETTEKPADSIVSKDIRAWEEASPDNPLVEYGRDGWNARRTVWVRPDGSVLEITRDNSVLFFGVFYGALTPLGFWYPGYMDWVGNFGHGLKQTDNTDSQRKLDRLIKERSAASAGGAKK
jgi:hypothetical protein